MYNFDFSTNNANCFVSYSRVHYYIPSVTSELSNCTQVDIHVAVTNKDDIENNSDKTPVFGGEVRYSVHARVTKSPDFEDDIEKKPVGRGELITSERKQFSDVDNGDKEMGAHGDISEDAKSASVNKPMDVTSTDEANDTHESTKMIVAPAIATVTVKVVIRILQIQVPQVQ